MALSYTYLVNKFRSILIEYGKDVYLRRRCISCTQSGDRAKYDDNCTVCGGTGFHQVAQRYTMRKMIVGSNFSFPTAMGIFASGVIFQEGTYFYCEASVLPKTGDIIYDWCEATASYDSYIIEKAIAHNYDSRVLYYTCSGEIREGT